MSTTISSTFFESEILNIFQVPLEEETTYNYVLTVNSGTVKLTIEIFAGNWEVIGGTGDVGGGESIDGSFIVPHVKKGSPGGTKTSVKFIFNRISVDDETAYEFTYQRA